jgi:hypothetical protein
MPQRGVLSTAIWKSPLLVNRFESAANAVKNRLCHGRKIHSNPGKPPDVKKVK